MDEGKYHSLVSTTNDENKCLNNCSETQHTSSKSSCCNKYKSGAERNDKCSGGTCIKQNIRGCECKSMSYIKKRTICVTIIVIMFLIVPTALTFSSIIATRIPLQKRGECGRFQDNIETIEIESNINRILGGKYSITTKTMLNSTHMEQNGLFCLPCLRSYLLHDQIFHLESKNVGRVTISDPFGSRMSLFNVMDCKNIILYSISVRHIRTTSGLKMDGFTIKQPTDGIYYKTIYVEKQHNSTKYIFNQNGSESVLHLVNSSTNYAKWTVDSNIGPYLLIVIASMISYEEIIERHVACDVIVMILFGFTIIALIFTGSFLIFGIRYLCNNKNIFVPLSSASSSSQTSDVSIMMDHLHHNPTQ